MVAQLLRLKLTLLGNTFRRSGWQRFGMILALTYAVGLVVLVAVGLAGLRTTSPDIARAVVIIFGSAVVLGFLVLPLVFSVDDPLDPRRFSLFGIPTTRLAVSIAVAAFVSVPTVVVTVFAIAQVVTWSASPGSVVLAVVAAILIVPTCVLAARVASGLGAFYLSARRVREAVGVLLLAVLAVLAPLVAILATIDWESRGLPIIRRIATVAAWTPFGAAWSIPADVAAGRPEAGLKFIIAVAFIAALWFAWRALVAHMLEKPQRAQSQRRYSGLGWFAVLPPTPGGAIAGRSLSYWGRDSRYRMTLVIVPVVPILMVVALAIAGVPGGVIAWLPVPVMCLFLGWSIHNDVALDSTAFWSHVSANASGTSDRWGRTIPALLVGIPLVVIGSIVTSALSNQWAALPGLMGLSASVLFAGMGISSVTSAAFPYPAVLPGDSAFAQPQAAGSNGSVAQAMSFFATLLTAAPVIYLVVLGQTVASGWHWAALAVGLLIGGVVYLGGIAWGGAIIKRHGPELLAFTLQN